MIKLDCIFVLGFLISASAHANWTYKSIEDEMTGKTKQYATIKSSNSLNLDFPYKGKNHVGITLRRTPGNGESIYISLDKGQIVCLETPCLVQVRFDQLPPENYQAVASSDFDQSFIFLWEKEKFVKAANAATQILIKLPIYQNGDNVVRFNSLKPLVWTYEK